MTKPSYKTGDIFLLFTELPFHTSNGDQPIKILENLYLDWTPPELFDIWRKRFSSSDCPDDLYNASLISAVRRGVRRDHCLRYENGKITQSPDEVDKLFSTFITALRLLKPCYIAVGGSFRFGDDDEPMQDTALWCLRSCHNLTDGSFYSQEDIQISSDIAKELLEILQSNNEERIKSSLVYFSQVTQGFSQYSFQLSYLGLWASLEAIFKPNGDKAKTLAKGITTYLSDFSHPYFSCPQNMEQWLEDEYIHRRSRLIHGSHIAPPKLQNNTTGPVAFSKLHEITRLCLLGFISLEKAERTQILQQKGRQLQHTLDNLCQARRKYLDQQKMYLVE